MLHRLKLVIGLFCFAIAIEIQAQEFIPKCNFDSLYTAQLNSEGYKNRFLKDEAEFQNYLKNRNKSESYTIPVVVHIVKNEDHDEMDITDQEIYRQIEILNEAYNSLNVDINQTPEMFDSLIGNPQIEFCLATVDPEGYATSGITRSTTDVLTFSTSLDNIKHSDLGGVDAWDTESYLNIWVGKITTGVLGYSHTPTASIPDDEHGLVVGYPYFGETEHEYYGLGKTAVHEIGHYLNLKHPWGIGGCDENNDWVDDTPISEGAYFGNPEHPQISCESIDMFMNYMDYVNDSSMVMFSQGQVDRMHFALSYYRSSLQESNGCGIPSLISEPQVIHASSELTSDASINLNIVSGIPPYSFIWEDGYQTESVEDLSPGYYSVQVVDSVGQELSLDFVISYYGYEVESDNFESYSMDSLLYLQSDLWSPYCSDSFAANIATLLAPEGIQYLEINASDGLNNFTYNLGSLDENAYNLSFLMYVPSGRAASYKFYHDASCSGPLDASLLEFFSDGEGLVKSGGNSYAFSFPQDQWFELRHLIDLDRDLAELFVNDVQVADWIFSWTVLSEEGNPRLGAIQFKDSIDSIDMVHYYIDDFTMTLTENSDLSTIENAEKISPIIYPNPTSGVIRLAMNQNVNGLFKIDVLNSVGQVLVSDHWDATNKEEFVVELNDFVAGLYFVRVYNQNHFSVNKFIYQE